mmetsp:Transcript_14453/g.27544  ORF Transcript_14453/g.27544 Transcript_14453/m.27544 type:complete len:272 (+) Transcript_14453:520-1335(+)
MRCPIIPTSPSGTSPRDAARAAAAVPKLRAALKVSLQVGDGDALPHGAGASALGISHHGRTHGGGEGRRVSRSGMRHGRRRARRAGSAHRRAVLVGHGSVVAPSAGAVAAAAASLGPPSASAAVVGITASDSVRTVVSVRIAPDAGDEVRRSRRPRARRRRDPVPVRRMRPVAAAVRLRGRSSVPRLRLGDHAAASSPGSASAGCRRRRRLSLRQLRRDQVLVPILPQRLLRLLQRDIFRHQCPHFCTSRKPGLYGSIVIHLLQEPSRRRH